MLVPLYQWQEIGEGHVREREQPEQRLGSLKVCDIWWLDPEIIPMIPIFWCLHPECG